MNIFVSILLLLLNVKLFSLIRKKFNYVYLAKFLYVYYLTEISISLILILIDYNYLLPDCHFYILPLRDLVLNWSLSVSISGIAIYLGLLISVKKNTGVILFFDWYEKTIQKSIIEKLSKVFALIFFIAVLFPFVPNFPYQLRIITLSFDFLPLFIGLYFSSLSKFNRFMWGGLMIINMLANLVQGSRGLAIIPIALFIIGFFISISENPNFKKQLLVVVLVFSPFFSFFGKIHDFRQEFGRGNDVTLENTALLVDYILEGNANSTGSSSNSMADGLSRFLNIGDFAIVNLTPNEVDYRGFIQLDDEILSVVTLHGAEGSQKFRERRASLMYGSGVLTHYGFSVDEKTSVGMGILGDSFSRFGFFGVFIYLMLITCFISRTEIFIREHYHNILGVILYLFLSYTFLYTLYGNSYFVFFKKIVFNGTLVFVVTSLLYKKYKS